MKIIFYDKQTNKEVNNEYEDYFIRSDGSVWKDNGMTWESQCSVLGSRIALQDVTVSHGILMMEVSDES